MKHKYSDEMDILERCEDNMACLGVENFAGSISKLKCALSLSSNGIDYIIKALVNFNNEFKNAYSSSYKEFDNVLSQIKRLYINIGYNSLDTDLDISDYIEDTENIDEEPEEDSQLIYSYGINEQLITWEDLDKIVKEFVLKIKEESDKTD